MHAFLAIAGSAINFAACLHYVRAILKGEASPNRVTWFLWALVPMIAGIAQLRAGVGISTLVVLSVGAGPAFVVLASFVRHTGSWSLGPFDYVCGACALAALALWATTGDPVIAIVLSILGILSIKEPTFAAYAFNAYLVAASSALVLVLYWPRRRGVTAT